MAATDRARKLWIASAAMIAVSGCLFQVSLICQRYFTYGVIREVEIAQKQFLTGPKVFVCTNLAPLDLNVANRTLVDFLGDKPYLNQSFSGVIPAQGNVEQQYCRTEKFVKNDYLCWSCSPSETKMDVFNPTDYMRYKGIMTVNLKRVPHLHTLAIYLKWYMLPLDGSPFGHSNSFIDHDILYDYKGQRCPSCNVWLSYTHYETHLLEAPYVTDCLDYSKHGCQSRAHCMELCEQSLAQTPFLIKGHLGTMNMSLKMKVNAGKPVTYGYWTDSMQNITKICGDKFRKTSCYNQYYIPKLIQFKMSKKKEVFMQLSPTSEPELSARSLKAIEMIDFIVYILSVISFWLGFCPLSCLLNEKVTNFVSSRQISYMDKIGFKRVQVARVETHDEIVKLKRDVTHLKIALMNMKAFH